MYVKTITVGGYFANKRPDIKGRGRTGIIRKPMSNMRVVMEEKTDVDFYKMMLKGETPVGLSTVLRKVVYQNKGDFEHIRHQSHLLTSKGRYYRKV